MKISVFRVNPFVENTYILWSDDTKDVVVVDPGISNDEEWNAFTGFLQKNGKTVSEIWLTHQHIDHMAGVERIVKQYRCKVKGSQKDASLGARAAEQAKYFGFQGTFGDSPITDELKEGDILHYDGEEVKVLEVPGHSQGGLAFYAPQSGCVFVGDSLFQQSIGRTDLPGGNYSQLIDSVKNKLMTLPDETVAYSGHGPATTIGDEKSYNPFIR